MPDVDHVRHLFFQLPSGELILCCKGLVFGLIILEFVGSQSAFTLY